MPGITKATYSQLEAARYESKHAVRLGDEDDGRLSPVVALLKLVMIRTFAITEDISPDWTEGTKLLNELTARAPIASTVPAAALADTLAICIRPWRVAFPFRRRGEVCFY